jgi:cephalosporin hydroxylase
MKISELDPNNLTDEQMTTLLYRHIHDDFRRGDCIFVFGSSKALEYRLPKAVTLYQEGRANKILFSGGTVWPGTSNPEAIALKNKAIKLGIPEKDILVETTSQHTKENVLASLLVLDRVFELHKIKRLLIVTTAYHMRRTLLNLKTYMPSWIEYSLCVAEDTNTKMDNWFLNEKGRQRVENETKKLITYIRQGAIMDENIVL